MILSEKDKEFLASIGIGEKGLICPELTKKSGLTHHGAGRFFLRKTVSAGKSAVFRVIQAM